MASASISASPKFIAIFSVAWHKMRTIDPQGIEILVPPDVSDAELGHAVRICLRRSREVSVTEIKSLVESSYARLGQWGAAMAHRYGYPSQRAFFWDLRICDVETRDDAVIQIRPTSHLKTKSWEYLEEQYWVKIAGHDGDDEAGKACRLALSRCV